jgi:hypothetical protein
MFLTFARVGFQQLGGLCHSYGEEDQLDEVRLMLVVTGSAWRHLCITVIFVTERVASSVHNCDFRDGARGVIST